jgi:hypothetical protein
MVLLDTLRRTRRRLAQITAHLGINNGGQIVLPTPAPSPSSPWLRDPLGGQAATCIVVDGAGVN